MDGMVGGILGCSGFDTENVVIENCTVSGRIAGEVFIGGLVGYSGSPIEIRNCVNYASVTSNVQCAGIIGAWHGFTDEQLAIIENCDNYGDIKCEKGEDSNLIGGICGEMAGRDGIIKNCTNYGKIYVERMDDHGLVGFTGGIAGDSYQPIVSCCNLGDITIVGKGSEIGGIVGENMAKIEKCYNKGNITAIDAIGVGGLVGYQREDRQNPIRKVINSSYNTGRIVGKEYVGGCVGQEEVLNSIEGSTTYENCYNTGSVEGTNYVGGIIGNCGYYTNNIIITGILENCYNIGAVTGQSNVGGLAGILIKKANSQIVNSYYLSGTASVAYFTDEEPATSSKAEEKTIEEMTKTEFVDVLNSNNEINWKEDKASINKKYPILNWQ